MTHVHYFLSIVELCLHWQHLPSLFTFCPHPVTQNQVFSGYFDQNRITTKSVSIAKRVCVHVINCECVCVCRGITTLSTRSVTAVAPDGEWPFLRGQAIARDCQTLCWALIAVGPCVCLYACVWSSDFIHYFLVNSQELYTKITIRTISRNTPAPQQQDALTTTFLTLIYWKNFLLYALRCSSTIVSYFILWSDIFFLILQWAVCGLIQFPYTWRVASFRLYFSQI